MFLLFQYGIFRFHLSFRGCKFASPFGPQHIARDSPPDCHLGACRGGYCRDCEAPRGEHSGLPKRRLGAEVNKWWNGVVEGTISKEKSHV